MCLNIIHAVLYVKHNLPSILNVYKLSFNGWFVIPFGTSDDGPWKSAGSAIFFCVNSVGRGSDLKDLARDALRGDFFASYFW